MKPRSFFFWIFFIFACGANAECPTQIECTNGSCVRVPVPSCLTPSAVTVIPATGSISGGKTQDANPSTAVPSPQNKVAKQPKTPKRITARSPVVKKPDANQPPTPPHFDCGSCADNGSCYEETGLSKNTQVSGSSGRHTAGKSILSGLNSFLGQSIEEKIALTVKDINKTLPKMIAEDIQLDPATAGPGKRMAYNYTVLRGSTCRNIRANLGALRQQVCNSKDTVFLLSKGVALVYSYHAPSGAEQFRLTVEPSDCR